MTTQVVLPLKILAKLRGGAPARRILDRGRATWRHRARRFWWLAIVVVLVAAGVTTVLLLPSSTRDIPPTRARVYQAFDACLLTGAQGLADPAVAPVWAGMQQASDATSAKVSYLAVTGPASMGNALSYAAALIQRHCDVVLAVGPAQIAAAEHDAPRYPQQRFVTLGGSPAGDNLTVVPTGTSDEVRSAVAELISRLAR